MGIRIKYADLDPILEELELDGRIRRTERGVDKRNSKADYDINMIFIR